MRAASAISLSRRSPAGTSTFGGMEVSEVKHLRALEKENEALKKIVAEQALDIRMLKDVNSKSGEPPGT